MKDDLQIWMTVPEAERYARVGTNKLRDAIERGEIRAYKTGRRYLKVSRSDVDAWIRANEYKPATTSDADFLD